MIVLAEDVRVGRQQSQLWWGGGSQAVLPGATSCSRGRAVGPEVTAAHLKIMY